MTPSLPAGSLTRATIDAHLRPLFRRALTRPEIYLASHSLGRPPDAALIDVSRAMDAWYELMDGAWEPWLETISRFRTGIASLVGLPDASLIVPKTSAGQGLRAVLNAMDSPRILTTHGEFDSIDFILRAYAERGRVELGWIHTPDGELIDEDALIAASRERKPDLVVVSAVFYATGQRLRRLRELVDITHHHGGHVLVDCYHAAGATPVNLSSLGVDFAIGGSYKYTRGGPGACWLGLSPRIADDRAWKTLDTGWFAKPDPFSFDRPEGSPRARGGDGWMESTPPVLPFVQALAGLEYTLAVGVDRLEAWRAIQLDRLKSLLHERSVGSTLLDAGGPFLRVKCDDAPVLADQLRAQGVVSDARLGHVRLCPDEFIEDRDLVRATDVISGVWRSMHGR